MRDGHARLEGTRGTRAVDQTCAVSVERWNARRRFTPAQRVILMLVVVGVLSSVAAAPGATWAAVQTAAWVLFVSAMVMRLGALALRTRLAPAPPVEESALPLYTVIAPLYREAGVCRQLTNALGALDYPAERLQILLVLEHDDRETLFELLSLNLPQPFEIFVAPPGWPKTKPRACNAALARAQGEHLVIYDAEDRPDPGQLREAAARFRADPDVACLQAPLRIDGVKDFLTAQFSLEYAAQFETLLPALHRLDTPFPLGGSSNHFRTEVLRRLGGWDAYNVTEDADLGFRLAAEGRRFGLLQTPTWEQAPQSLAQWLPQRTRWIKGHLHTWLVHMRRPGRGGMRRFAALQCTLGLGVLSALTHGPLLLVLLVGVALEAAGQDTFVGSPALPLLLGGWLSALASMRAGARRAHVSMSWRDALAAPLYWPLHSLAAVRALWQFARRPHHWNKTEHQPSAPALD